MSSGLKCVDAAVPLPGFASSHTVGALQVGEPKAAQSLGKRLMTTGFVVGVANSLMAGVFQLLVTLACTVAGSGVHEA